MAPRLLALLSLTCSVLAAARGAVDYGLYTVLLNSDILKCNLNKSLGLDVSKVELYMYDFDNNVNTSYTLHEAAGHMLASSAFNPTRRVLIVVHGFSANANDSQAELVRQNLKHVPNSYILFVDHSAYTYLSSVLTYVSSYERAVKYYWDIGQAVAEFLVGLVDGGVSVDIIHLMGHSLGAHIIAAAGEHYYNTTGEFIPRLSGIDPAGPCFTKADTRHQLRSGVAAYVETYHANAGELGTDRDLADVNYYMNGGKTQPGCTALPVADVLFSAAASICSHSISQVLFTYTATRKDIYQAVQCDSYAYYKDGTCSSHGADTTVAGYYSPMNVTGKYYFNT